MQLKNTFDQWPSLPMIGCVFSFNIWLSVETLTATTIQILEDVFFLHPHPSANKKQPPELN